MKIRSARATDTDRLRARGFRQEALNDPSTHIFVAEDETTAAYRGASCWVAPQGGPALLGEVMPQPWSRTAFVHLLRACISEAVDLGYRPGRAEVPAKMRAVMRFLNRGLGLTPRVAGRNGRTGEVDWWAYEVDLPEFLRVLDDWLARKT